MKLKILLSWMAWLFLLPAIAQQDPLNGLYFNNNLLINPAYAGLYEQLSANLTHRAQWTGVEGAPASSAFNVHSSLYQNRIGAGLMVIQDQLGVTNSLEVSAAYAYKISMLKGTLSLGLQTSLYNIRNDYSKLLVKDADDAFVQDVNLSRPNFGTGALYVSERLMLGVSVPRLLKMNSEGEGVSTVSAYQRHLYLQGAGVIDLNSKMSVRPAAYLRYTGGAPANYDLRADLIYDKMLMAGVFSRSFEQYGMSFGIFPRQRFRLIYQYELPLSPLANRYNTHEISLGIDLAAFKSHQAVFRYF
ncbi:MAG: type IX secretion system membrane protein PorP/SprF [Cyclobacteriaceae bacterium]